MKNINSLQNMCMTKSSIMPISLYQPLKFKKFFKIFLKKKKDLFGQALMFFKSTKSTCCLLDFEPLKHKRTAFYVRMRAFNGNTVGASNMMAGNRELA